MTDSEKRILEGFLSKTLKIDSEEMAGLYNEAGELISLDKPAEADASRIKKLKSDSADQFKRGLKEGAEKIEKAVKDKYGVESDNIGVELIDEIFEQKIAEVKVNTDDVTKHPEYIKLQRSIEKQLKAKDTEWQGKLEESEKNHKKQSVFTKVKEKALAELDALKPILPEDAKKAQKWREKFIEEFSKYEYQEQEDGEIVALKDGKPIQDSHGYGKTFTDHVKETAADFFEFKTAENRSSAGNKQQDGSKPPEIIIKDKADFIEKSRLAKTPEERIKIAESYEKINK